MSVPISNDKSSTQPKPNSTRNLHQDIENNILDQNSYSHMKGHIFNDNTYVNPTDYCIIGNSNFQSKINRKSLPRFRNSVELIIISKTSDLFKNRNSPIKINEFGIEPNNQNSQRNFIFFGSDEINSNDHSYDIIMSIGGNGNKHSELFYILYETNTKTFILKSLTKELPFSVILFPKQPIPLEYNQKNYFQLGKSNLSLLPKTHKEETIIITIKKGKTISEKQIYEFIQSKCPITIGRSQCHVNVTCDSVSKCHAIIDYDYDNHHYYIYDNQSDKGSLLLLKKGRNLKLNGEMLFDLNNRRFTVKEIVS